jgi:hypothetical protein
VWLRNQPEQTINITLPSAKYSLIPPTAESANIKELHSFNFQKRIVSAICSWKVTKLEQQ